MAEPLLVEIIAYAPTAYYHCTHCEVAWRGFGADNYLHDEQVAGSLPSDLMLEYQVLSDWIHDLFRRYCDRIAVGVIDAASLEGFFKTLRYGTHHLPAVIVGSQARFSGPVAGVVQAATAEVAVRLQAEPVSV